MRREYARAIVYAATVFLLGMLLGVMLDPPGLHVAGLCVVGVLTYALLSIDD